MTVSSDLQLDRTLAARAEEFLRGELPAESMAWQLWEGGYSLDCELLRLSTGGPGPFVMSDMRFKGRRVFTGPLPPEKAAIGDVWYDTRELVPTMLVPQLKVLGGRVSRSTGKPRGWMSLTPVRRWQVLAFESMARVTWDRPFEAAVRFRNRRWETCGDQRFAGGLIQAEGRAFASWVGKDLQTTWGHNALYLVLPAELQDQIVGAGEGRWEEWAGDVFDHGQTGIVGSSSYRSILPANILEPDSFATRRLVRTCLPARRAAQVRKGFQHVPPQKDFVIRGVLKR